MFPGFMREHEPNLGLWPEQHRHPPHRLRESPSSIKLYLIMILPNLDIMIFKKYYFCEFLQ